MEKYLVVTGDEYGFDLGNLLDLSFRPLEAAEIIYNDCLEEYGCAALYKVTDTGLVLVKMESNF